MRNIMITMLLACIIILAGCGGTGQTVSVAQQEQEGKLVTVKEQSVEVHKPTVPPTTVPSEQNESQDDVDDTSNEDVPEDDSTDTDSESDDDPVVSGDSEKILILKFKGNPSELEIKVGTTVIWENADVYGHVIGIFKVIEGPMLHKGETWSYAFNEPGNYTWMSTGHPRTNGEIIVTE